MVSAPGLVKFPLFGVLLRNLSNANFDREMLMRKTTMFDMTGVNRNCSPLTICARYSIRKTSESTKTDALVVVSDLVALVVTTSVLNVVEGFRMTGRCISPAVRTSAIRLEMTKTVPITPDDNVNGRLTVFVMNIGLSYMPDMSIRRNFSRVPPGAIPPLVDELVLVMSALAPPSAVVLLRGRARADGPLPVTALSSDPYRARAYKLKHNGDCSHGM